MADEIDLVRGFLTGVEQKSGNIEVFFAWVRSLELPSTGVRLRDIMSSEVASQGGSGYETETG